MLCHSSGDGREMSIPRHRHYRTGTLDGDGCPVTISGDGGVMPQQINVHVGELVAAAEREIETLPTGDAISLHGREDVVFVDLRDIRELGREGRIPGAFHCPRGMLEFWIDPQSKYFKPTF